MNARALLIEVMKILAPFGRVSVRFRTLELDGEPVAFLNQSEALVISPTYRGFDVVVPARTVSSREDPAMVASEILDRASIRAPLPAPAPAPAPAPPPPPPPLVTWPEADELPVPPTPPPPVVRRRRGAKIETPARKLVREVLQATPMGSLLRIEYEPAKGPRRDALAAALALGSDPRAYVVELLSVAENAKGEPFFAGRVLNQGGVRRLFAPFKGTLSKLELLRAGPAQPG